MTYILWNDPFYVDPTTGDAYATYQDGTIPVPKYGNYGGAFSDPSSFDPVGVPVDQSDYYYSLHDAASGGDATSQAYADIALITNLTFGDSSYSADPEATLYDGIVTAGLLGSLALNGQLGLVELVEPGLLGSALVDAARDIEFGLDHLPKPELNLALDSFFEQSGKNTFTYNFEITTHSIGEEFVEAAAIQAVASAINEKNDPAVNTFSGFWGGTSEYEFLYNIKTHDLDLFSV
jgi:hypothetical protein